MVQVVGLRSSPWFIYEEPLEHMFIDKPKAHPFLFACVFMDIEDMLAVV